MADITSDDCVNCDEYDIELDNEDDVTIAAAMSDFLSVMEPFVQITEALGGEEWITIIMV